MPLKPPGQGQELAVGKDCTPPEEGKAWDTTKCPFIGNLYNDSYILHVYVAGKPEVTKGAVLLPLRVTGDYNVGVYEGDLDPGGSGDEKEAVPLKLSVTDAWWCAAIALVLGSIPVIFLQLWAGRWRPKSDLERRRNALIGAYETAETQLHDHGFKDIKQPGKEKVAAYSDEVKEAMDAYAESVLVWDTSSDAYKQLDASLKLAEGDASYLGRESGLARSLKAMKTELGAVAKLFRSHFPPQPEPAMALTAASLLKGMLEVGEASKRGATADTFSGLLRQWCQMVERLLGYENRWHDLDRLRDRMTEDDQATLREARIKLREVRSELIDAADVEALERIGTAKDLNEAYGWVVYLESAYVEVFEFEDFVTSTVAQGAEEEQERDGDDDQEVDDGSNGLTNNWKGQSDDIAAQAARAVELARTKRIVGDALAFVVSVVIGIATGLSVVFFGKNFGTTEDYITVIVVGTAAQLLAKTIMDRLAVFWPGVNPTATKDPAGAKLVNMPAA